MSSSLPFHRFRSRLQEILDSDRVMGMHSGELDSLLSELWEPSSRELRTLLESSRVDELEGLHERNLRNGMDIDDLSVEIQLETKRRVHEEAPSEQLTSGETQTEERVLKCEANIDPVRGVPVQKLREGDQLLVDLSDDADPGKALRDVLDQRREQKRGMIPSRIVSRRATDTGKVHFRVQFGRMVYGELVTSGDVSLSVPEASEGDTSRGDSRTTAGGIVQTLASVWPVVLGLVVVVVLLLYFLI